MFAKYTKYLQFQNISEIETKIKNIFSALSVAQMGSFGKPV
jgi:hypothetical protein